jgi:hypothetical protein
MMFPDTIKTKIIIALLGILLTASEILHAEETHYGLIYELPVADIPYNVSHGGRFPSMYQSLSLTTDLYQVSHLAFSQAKDSWPRLSLIASGFCDLFILAYLPGGNSWLHEEWHRAVMGQYGINSFNDVYYMDIGATSISVSHVKDSDLECLKNCHPADMVRLSEAGIEGEYTWIETSRENFFFSGKSTDYERLAWIFSTLNSSLYIGLCTTHMADRETENFNRKEKGVRERDFTGLDFTAWVYDLFRPEEPYSARGTHPSGTGYDRYIKYSDLTGKEKNYLRRQFWLSLLNFVSPQLYGIDSIKTQCSMDGSACRSNFAMMHYLTSFGSSTELHMMSSSGGINSLTVLRLYQSESLFLPGIELGIRRFALRGIPLLLDVMATGWLQPKNQMFHEKGIMPGAGVRAKVSYPVTSMIEIYLFSGAKTDGWQAGEVSLKAACNGGFGMQVVY